MRRNFGEILKAPLFFTALFSGFSLSFNAWATHPAQLGPDVPYRVSGGYRINAAKINDLNPGLTQNRYGTFTLTDEDNNPVSDPFTGDALVIRDQHYPLFDFQRSPVNKWNDADEKLAYDPQLHNKPRFGYGQRLIPAVTGFYTDLAQAPQMRTAANSAGKSNIIRGSELVDKYLREVVYNYKGEDAKTGPIFAQIAYMHPEGFQGPPSKLSDDPLYKTEMGFTHKGAYLGNGKTVNSPVEYHGDSWWDDSLENYPALLSVFDFRGAVDADNNFNIKAFNQNAITTALIMNESFQGPTFPDKYDYHFAPVYPDTLEHVLDFYARWLRKDESLHTDDLYKLYCAAHITDIINTHLNLPQNLTSYQEVYGKEEGEFLFNKAVDAVYRSELRSKEIGAWIRDAYLSSQEEFARRDRGESMTPYWKLMKLQGPLVARNAQTGIYEAPNGSPIKLEGYSLAWTPETLADLARDFVQEYMTWTKVGGVKSSAAILGFASEVQKRMNIPLPEYLAKITPIIQQIFLHEAAAERGYAILSGQTDDAKLKASFEAARAAKIAGLDSVFDTFMTAGAPTMDQDDVASAVKQNVANFTDLIEDKGINTQSGWARVVQLSDTTLASFQAGPAAKLQQKLLAYREHVYTDAFEPTIAPTLIALNKLDPNPTPDLTVKFYYAPAVHVRVGLGTHDPASRKFVRIWHVATVIRADETEPAPDQNSPFIDDAVFTDYSVFN